MLLGVARVARTRFYVPPAMDAAAIRAADPVVTANDDRLRFESFSACAGVYARFDLMASSLEGAFMGYGTTNVDFNMPMRSALGSIADSDRVTLSVGLDELEVEAEGEQVVERKVPLPTRWVKGFAEVQVFSSRMVLMHELSVGSRVARLRRGGGHQRVGARPGRRLLPLDPEPRRLPGLFGRGERPQRTG